MRKRLQLIKKEFKKFLSDIEEIRLTDEVKSINYKDGEWNYPGEVLCHFINKDGSAILTNIDRLISQCKKCKKSKLINTSKR